jgi:hypothetical protein
MLLNAHSRALSRECAFIEYCRGNIEPCSRPKRPMVVDGSRPRPQRSDDVTTTLQTNAEALFKKMDALLVEPEREIPHYEAYARAMREKIARLRALRLARDAAGAAAA